jgi:anti-sigma regulatory factor (Ser/Thr protein kinase)
MTGHFATRTQTVPPPRPHQPELAGWPLHAALPLGALPTAPGCGRAWTRQVLREWGLDRLADDCELLVSELTTNAVQASAPIADAVIGLWLASDGERAVILVWDPTLQPPAPANPGQDAEDGRGLLLVQALSLQWGWYIPASTSLGGHAGKMVWAILG